MGKITSRILKGAAIGCALISLMGAHAAAAKPFKIGVSNAYVDTWRSQMLDTMKKANEAYVKDGVTEELVIQSGNTDVQGQIAQIRSLINEEVDAILVVPSSQTALNPVLEEAIDAGIKVYSITQEVSAPKVVGVMVDQAEWARIHARWLAKTLDGKGGVVVINGLAGAPASESRFAAVKEVFAESPDIQILNAANGDWDQVKAQQVMSSILAAQPKIDGVWVSGAMSEGVLRAIIAANPATWPAVTGDSNLGYLRLWQEVRKSHPDFKSLGVIDPPGLAGSAGLKIAINMLNGRELKDDALTGPFKNSLFVKLPGSIEADALDKVLADNADKPSTYFVDHEATDEEVGAFLK